MPDTPDRHGAPAPAADEIAPATPVVPTSDLPGAALPRPVQEHLGLQLRTSYNEVMEEKPAYLGDPALPLEFELQLQRLDANERRKFREQAHERGIEAVAQALNLDPDEADPDARPDA